MCVCVPDGLSLERGSEKALRALGHGLRVSLSARPFQGSLETSWCAARLATSNRQRAHPTRLDFRVDTKVQQKEAEADHFFGVAAMLGYHLFVPEHSYHQPWTGGTSCGTA